MNSPIARHLTRFTGAPVAMLAPEPQPEICEPRVTLTVADFEERLQAERERARAEALAGSERRLEQLKAEQVGGIDRALAQARTTWVSDQASVLNASCDAAMAAFRELMFTRLADVLRPLLAELVIKRAVSGLSEMMDRLLADPSHPLVKVRGPTDLIEALKAARSHASGLEFEACEAVEIVMTAEGSHVETRIAAALSALFTEALS